MASLSAQGNRRRPRLFLADDHRMLLESLGRHLAEDYEIAGMVCGGEELVSRLPLEADCLLLDLCMPGWNGLELIGPIRCRQPDLGILVLTMMIERSLAELAIRLGADGFIPKDAGLDELRFAIGLVVQGRRYVSPRLTRCGQALDRLTTRHPALYQLTPRQQEILLLLGEGRLAASIAKDLGVAPSTVTFHKQRIMQALGFESEAMLTQFAVLVRTGVSGGDGNLHGLRSRANA